MFQYFGNSEILFVVYVLVFVGVLLAFEGLRQALMYNSSDAAARNRRLRAMRRGASTAEVLELLRPPKQGGLLGLIPYFGNLRQLLSQAGLTISPPVFIAICLLSSVPVYIFASRYVDPGLAAMGAIAVVLFFPMALVYDARKKRMEKLEKQLPDALDLMARGLRVGHPLNATVASVAQEMPDPIGSEFGILLDQVSYGDDIATGFADLAERIGTEDVQMLSVSVGIQHGTGGNLARILEVLAQVIRDRSTMRRKIRALSSEGRLSANILSALPVLIYAIMSVLVPSFYGDIKDDPLFLPIAIAIVTLVFLNFIMLKKLVNFDF
ncbi:tight adherence protein B [Rhodovulum iodosum]|uniref:Tight adherence protein B n=1 Tax=Rhodovulum iodosum TaxID=68291 RepID=A0ABV3XWK1_9RHOB|nr:type II secretion system F family protein [Rhodovulum robiginosum]RSK34204.1 type II secretion system F family protein [Rhodovulum robiginosum]